MKNLWRSIAPFATDTSGACAVFANSSALVISQDSNGTVTCLRRVIDIYAGQAEYETIDLPEVSFTLGRENDFQERMTELFEMNSRSGGRYSKPPIEFAVLVNGPVSSLLGTDLANRAALLEQEIGIPVFSIETTGNQYYDKGIERAYDVIYDHFAEHDSNEERMAECVNLIGMTQLDYPGFALAQELAAALSREHKHVLCDLGYGDNQEAWKHMLRAGMNIVMSASGLKLARRIQREKGVPFIPVYGLNWFDGLANGLHMASNPRILIVGEQITSNLLRRLLRACGAKEIKVATFFMFDRECAEAGDMRLKGERDLHDLFERESFDFVIGDAALAPLCSDTHLVSLMHPPTGFGKRDGTELSRVWLQYLVQGIDSVMTGEGRE